MTHFHRGALASIRTILGLFCALAVAPAQNLAEFEKKITEFDLPNGMHFIVLERHDAPVVSFHMLVNAGSVDDPGGKSGLAHMFEHMIGKGTMTVGTRNWEAERKAMADVEIAYDKLEAERAKGPKAEKAALVRLEGELQALLGQAASFVDQNAFVRVIEENGGAGFNAGTAKDITTYFYSLPSNRAELWFLLQSDWLRKPIFREFYKERAVVMEERQMRVDSNPGGQLQEALMGTAFLAHPYRNLLGWATDITNLRVADAEAFHKTYYVPGNITVAIAGDISGGDAKTMATKYFGAIPAGPLPPRVATVEPAQAGEKRVAIESDSQPLVMIAYKRPSDQHPDDPVLDVVASILSSGRTGLLYRELVRDKKVALEAQAGATTPGSRYPNLFVIFAAPNAGKTVEENEKAVFEIVDRLKAREVDGATLDRVKTQVRAGLIRSLDSNSGLAESLASHHATYGDWRKLFTGIADIEKVTAGDVQRVMNAYFGAANRTVAYITAKSKEAGK